MSAGEEKSAFGELGLISGELRSATIKTEEWTELLVITAADFHTVLKTYSDLLKRKARLIACFPNFHTYGDGKIYDKGGGDPGSDPGDVAHRGSPSPPPSNPSSRPGSSSDFHISPQYISKLSLFFRELVYTHRSIVFAQGDRCDKLYFLVSGEVELIQFVEHRMHNGQIKRVGVVLAKIAAMVPAHLQREFDQADAEAAAQDAAEKKVQDGATTEEMNETENDEGDMPSLSLHSLSDAPSPTASPPSPSSSSYSCGQCLGESPLFIRSLNNMYDYTIRTCSGTCSFLVITRADFLRRMNYIILSRFQKRLKEKISWREKRLAEIRMPKEALNEFGSGSEQGKVRKVAGKLSAGAAVNNVSSNVTPIRSSITLNSTSISNNSYSSIRHRQLQLANHKSIRLLPTLVTPPSTGRMRSAINDNVATVARIGIDQINIVGISSTSEANTVTVTAVSTLEDASMPYSPRGMQMRVRSKANARVQESKERERNDIERRKIQTENDNDDMHDEVVNKNNTISNNRDPDIPPHSLSHRHLLPPPPLAAVPVTASSFSLLTPPQSHRSIVTIGRVPLTSHQHIAMASRLRDTTTETRAARIVGIIQEMNRDNSADTTNNDIAPSSSTSIGGDTTRPSSSSSSLMPLPIDNPREMWQLRETKRERNMRNLVNSDDDEDATNDDGGEEGKEEGSMAGIDYNKLISGWQQLNPVNSSLADTPLPHTSRIHPFCSSPPILTSSSSSFSRLKLEGHLLFGSNPHIHLTPTILNSLSILAPRGTILQAAVRIAAKIGGHQPRATHVREREQARIMKRKSNEKKEREGIDWQLMEHEYGVEKPLSTNQLQQRRQRAMSFRQSTLVIRDNNDGDFSSLSSRPSTDPGTIVAPTRLRIPSRPAPVVISATSLTYTHVPIHAPRMTKVKRRTTVEHVLPTVEAAATATTTVTVTSESTPVVHAAPKPTLGDDAFVYPMPTLVSRRPTAASNHYLRAVAVEPIVFDAGPLPLMSDQFSFSKTMERSVMEKIKKAVVSKRSSMKAKVKR